MAVILCIILLSIQVAASPTQRTTDDEFVDIQDSHKTSMADDIELTFNMQGQTMTLKLHKNKGINMNIPIIYGSKQNTNVMLDGTSGNRTMCIYSDPKTEASVIVDMEHGTKHYTGQFFVSDTEYRLKPVDIMADLPSNPHDTTGPDTVKHVISRLRQEQGQGSNEDVKQHGYYESMHVNQWASVQGLSRDIPVARAYERLQDNSASNTGNELDDKVKEYDVEMLFVIDYSIYREWYILSDKPSEEERMKEALQNIQFYFTHIANGASMRYSSLQDKDFQMNAVLSGFYIATERDAAPWTRDNTINFDPKDIIDGDPALRQFQDWLEENSGNLPPFDQATLFIDDYLKGWSGNRILGMAIIEGVCSRYSTAISREVGQYGTTQTFAHEMGHSLGAYHDGSNNNCKGADQYIMAPYPITLTTANFGNPFKFSKCSLDYLKGFIAYMDKKNYNCLENKGYAVHNSTSILSTLPGQQYTPDQQCVLIFGPGAYYCGGNTEDKNICFRMECFSPVARRCVIDAEQRAATGTTCGNKKWCQKGVCTYSPKAPTAKDSCTYGDYKGPYTNGLNCMKIGIEQPWICYNKYYLDDCCKTCDSIKDLSRPDCPYGDREASCANITVSQCRNSTIKQTCCKTCHNYTDNSACPTKDFNWCGSYIQSALDCYYEPKRCCNTCHKYKTNMPGCEYGDSVTWCPSYISNGRLCYLEGQRCCQTCQKYRLTGIKNCTYGDRAADCANKRCSDPGVREQCCYTCAQRETTTTTTTTASPTTTTKPTTTASTTFSTTFSTNTAIQPSSTTTPPPPGSPVCVDRDSSCRTTHSSYCYTNTTRDRCCATCMSYQTKRMGCEYGDYYTWCSKKYCNYSGQPQLYDKCCASCWPKVAPTEPPQKACIDKANWCKNYTSYCYDEETKEDICCQTCRSIYNPNKPGCEYGDKRTWCGPQWCHIERKACCQTCT